MLDSTSHFELGSFDRRGLDVPVDIDATVELELADAAPTPATLYRHVESDDAPTVVLPRIDDVDVEPKVTAAEQDRPGWFRRNRLKLALGAAALSTAVTLVANPLDAVMEPIKAKWLAVGLGMIATDVVWGASAAVMYRSAFGEWRNPFKLSQDDLAEAAARAYSSKLFKTAYAVNTLAATAFFAIPTVAVTATLPPEAWGVLTPAALEFTSTVALRVAINEKLKEHGQK